MKKQCWIFWDATNSCHRFWHASQKSTKGMVWKFLTEIRTLQDRFQTHHIAFAFDRGESLRRKLVPSYKQKLKQSMFDREKKARDQFHNEMNRLREFYLPSAGFFNVFSADGYEADDIIASLCMDNPEKKIIIVSTDRDLWQMLSRNKSWYDPQRKTLLTYDEFRERYGIESSEWATVKAIAGKKHEMRGIIGVGESYALKHIRGELTKGNAFNLIQKNLEVIDENLQLTTLPYSGCPQFRLYDDSVSRRTWSDLVEGLGMPKMQPNSTPIFSPKGK